MQGNVIANGRPNQYRSIGANVSKTSWFQQATKSSSGNEYGFESVTANPLTNNSLTLAYSCGVRRDGDANGQLIGVLGILFDWESLAQTLLKNTPIDPSEAATTRCCIVDKSGKVLADSDNKILKDRISLAQLEAGNHQAKSWARANIGAHECFIGHASAPGYETYSTGWHSLIIQQVQPNRTYNN